MRKAAKILLLIALIEVAGILLTATHEEELIEARLAYETAWAEHEKLTTVWGEMK